MYLPTGSLHRLKFKIIVLVIFYVNVFLTEHLNYTSVYEYTSTNGYLEVIFVASEIFKIISNLCRNTVWNSMIIIITIIVNINIMIDYGHENFNNNYYCFHNSLSISAEYVCVICLTT